MSEVIEKASTEIAPSYIDQNSNRGNENITSEDLQLPRIDVLQDGSPQLKKKNEDKYIEGAAVGMLFNTLTNELYPNGVYFTPVSFVRRYLVWVDRKIDTGGGLRGVFDTQHEAEAMVEVDEDKAKLEIVPTAEHLVLMDDGQEVIISMAKSKMKVSRKFNSLVRLSGGDRFGARYHMIGVDDTGAQGDYQNIAIDKVGYPEEKVYFKAVALHQAMQGGTQKSASYEGEVVSEEY